MKPKLTGRNNQLPQIIAILAASFGGLSQGLLYSWTSPAVPELMADNSTNISFEEASYFALIPQVVMIITCPLCALLINIYGRKTTILLMAVPQLLAWILIGCTKNVWVLYIARFLCGIQDAAFFSACPIYACEVAQPKVRGSWGSSVSINIYIGIFVINVVGAYNDITTTALICGWLPLLHIAMFAFMPESPYYLLMKGREEEAKKSLSLLRWRCDVDEELKQLKADVARQISESGTFKELFSIKSNRRAVIMCSIMRIAQQFSGLPAFELYTQYLFQEAGGNVSHKVSAIIFSGVLALTFTLAAVVVARFGRRPLMIFSCFGCGIVLGIEAIYFTLRDFTNIDLSNFSWFPLTGLLLFLVIGASGIGLLPTLVLGEIFSASVKGKASSIMNILQAFCALTASKLFQTLTYNYGILGPFYVFSSFCIGCGILSCFYVIETKDKTLEEIQQELKN